MYSFIFLFCIAFFLSLISTFYIGKIATKLKILDYPGKNRKIHKNPTPLLGGFAIYISFFITLLFDYLFFEHFAGSIGGIELFGLFIAGTILMVGGFIDDKYDIGVYSFLFPCIAVIIMLIFNIGIDKITNTLGGIIYLDIWKIPIWKTGDIIYYFTVFVDIFTILWLLGMTYTTKLLDGLDGLVAGITAIGSFIIFLLTMTDKYYQPDVGFMALILFAACLGFLVFNFHPARIFLGEGGSVFTGFMLGVLAIISGGKIATALLVMGIPILDIIWVIGRRIKCGKSVTHFDSMHLHHRLIKSGLNQRQAVVILYILSFTFGITTLFLQSLQKILVLILLVAIMMILGYILINSCARQEKSQK